MKTQTLIRNSVESFFKWLTPELQSISIGYQPKIIFTGGMYGSYVSQLNDLLKMGERLKSAENITLKKYGDSVQVEIYLDNEGSSHKPIFLVDMRETKKGTLEQALGEFLTCAGQPSTVDFYAQNFVNQFFKTK